MSDERVVPTPAKKQRAGRSSDVLNPQRVLLSLRSLFEPAPEPSAEHIAPAPTGSGTEEPDGGGRIGDPIAVVRTFAFVDITSFTQFCDRHGEHEAIDLLTRFRSLVRDITARRGVRVAKWLGDGVMLVGVEEGPIVATVAEIVLRCHTADLDTHAGVAAGTVLLFEGDDYVGRPANLAARLCDAADSGEILAYGLHEPYPPWVEEKGNVTVEVTGVGELDGVHSIGAIGDVVARLATEEPFEPVT